MDCPLNLVGLGGKCTSLLGFIILHVQVQGITGYDEDAVFLVVPDESDFGRRVPLVVGTCTIARIFNVIQESEIDHLPCHSCFPAGVVQPSPPLGVQRLRLKIPVGDPQKGALMGWLWYRRASAWGHSRLRS